MMIMEYHQLFMLIYFILLFSIIYLIFIEKTKEAYIAGSILLGISFIICIIVMYGFSALSIFGFDTTGTIVDNIYSDMADFTMMWWAFIFINIMLSVYNAFSLIEYNINEYKRKQREKEEYDSNWA